MKNLFTLFALLVLFILPINAQNMEDVEIKTEKLSDNVYVLFGRGGNIGVSIGEDGVFVIDDQFEALSEKIIAAIRELSDKPIHFLANTHYHGDHTGGNAKMHEHGANIIAHDNVRKRLLLPNRNGNTAPKEALPVITFYDKMNLYINGEKVEIFHFEHAHTDGDAMLYFTKSNVLHTGDLFFNYKTSFPFIDVDSGGNINGYIKAVSGAIAKINDDTTIIPGHGAVSNRAEYSAFLDVLKDLRSRVQMALDNGKTEDEIMNDASILKSYEDKGYGKGFVTSERIKRAIFRSLTQGHQH